MKKTLAIGLLALAGALPTLSHAINNIDTGDIEKKTIKGYTLHCHAQGDLAGVYWLQNPKHKPYNFCQTKAVETILKEAAKIKGSNFGDGLKLIKFRPYNTNDYALVVMVDDKNKKIHVDNTLFATPPYDKSVFFQKDVATYRKHKGELGPVYSKHGSNMYCFKTLGMSYVRHGAESSFVEVGTTPKPVCFEYIGDHGDLGGSNNYNFTFKLDEEYHFWGGLDPKDKQ